ncbi:hypothetical protein OAO01_04815 [Oligoflexia bacterium]|nr:hypothetical protein [Oligoflexia bacterium]
MSSKRLLSKRRSIFKRQRLILKVPLDRPTQQDSLPVNTPDTSDVAPEVEQPPVDKNFTALVINASQDMAKEITMQLTLDIPGCSIMYAPSIELAKWILKRRNIQLVVSSPVLPDGGISKLNDALATLKSRPDVVVVGNMNAKSAEALNAGGYEFATMRQIGKKHLSLVPEASNAGSTVRHLNKTISSLGADIRNDLNNPLQEIVAMVFVAQATSAVATETTQALTAIDKAAKNMSAYVNELERKIHRAVAPHTK